MNTALILIDIQNDYFPGGRVELEGPLDAARQAQQLLETFRTKGWPIIHIQHISTRPGATFFLPGTTGAELHGSVSPLPGEKVVVKHFPNSFRETGLEAHLQPLKVERLVLAGNMTHMCVDASMRAAVDLGYQVLLACDACATRALVFQGTTVPARHVQAAFLAALQSYGQVLTTEQILGVLAEAS